ncbi:unnamed protein product [Closterium sp. NIES-54]
MEAEGSAPAGPSGSGGVRGAGEAGRGVEGGSAPFASVSTPPKNDVKAFNLEKFSGEDWASWSFRMELLFNHYGLLEVMDGKFKRPASEGATKEWDRRSKDGFFLLCQCLSSNQLHHVKHLIKDIQCGPKAWKILKNVHAPSNEAMVVVLEQQLHAVKINEGDSVQGAFGQLRDLYVKLSAAGVDYPEKIKCYKALSLLPESWGPFVVNLNGMKDSWSFEWIRAQVLQEESRKKELTAAAGEGGGYAYGMKGFKGCGSKKGKAKEGSRGEQHSVEMRSNKGGKRCGGKCWYCHVEGHPWFKCRKLPDGWRPGQPSIEGSKGVHGAMGEGMGSEEGDGGAGEHGGMFYHDLVDEVRPSKAATIVSAAGQVVLVHGEGRAMFMGADGKLVGLKRVLLVPGLCANILSTKAFSEARMKMEMMGTKVFKATLDGRVLWDLRGGKDMHQSMWEIPVLPWKEAGARLAAEAVRGGHASHVTNGGGGDGSDGGMLVHGGGALPSVTPSTGETDWLTAHRRFGHVALPQLQQLFKEERVKGLRIKGEPTEKSDAARVIIEEWLSMVERGSGKRVKAIRSDRGGEFLGAEFRSWLKRHGIKQQLTTAYTPLSNGVAERANRTIIKGGRTILVDSGLPLQFWPLAIRHATVIKNRVLTHVGGQHWVPMEKWSPKSPWWICFVSSGAWSSCMSLRRSVTSFKRRRYGLFIWQGEAPVAERGDTEEEVQQSTPSPKLPPRRTTQGKRDAVRGGAKEGAAKERLKRAAHPRDFLKYERLGVPKALLVQEEEDEEEKGAEGEMEQICCFGVNLPHELASMEETLAGDDREAWLASREDDFHSHMENETWTLTNLPLGRKALDCTLNKAIYGLKQAPRCWYARLVEALEALGFKVSRCDESLFMTEGEEEKVFLLVYVDDILLFSPSMERIKEVQVKLKETFQYKALGPVGYYLGLHVERDEVKGWLRLHQHKYLATMGEKYGLEEGRSVKTPLPSGFQLHLDKEEGEVLEYELQRWFQSMVGRLMYVSVNTRPNIAFSVSQLARVVSRPLQEHLDVAERLVRSRSAGADGPRGARTRGTGAAGAGGAGGAGAGDPGAGGAGAGGTGASGPGGSGAARAGDVGAGGTEAGGTGPWGAGVVGAGSRDTGRPRPYLVPLLQHVFCLPSSTGLTPPLLCPLPDQSQPPLQPASPVPAPSPYTEQTGGLTERREPVSRPASPVCAIRTGRPVTRPRPPPVPGTHHTALRPSSIPRRVPLLPPPTSSLANGLDPESDLVCAASPSVPRLLATVVTDPLFESADASALVAELVDFAAAYRLDYAASLVAESEYDCPPSIGGECALGTDVLEYRQEDFDCFAAAVPHLVSMLIAPEGDPDAPDIPTPHSYAEAITGPYSSQWQTAMDAEMASWKSTCTYVDAVPPPGANIVLQHFDFQYSSPKSTPLPTGHSLSAPPSDESVEPSGLYPELVGCLMYLMTCTRPDLAYPLSILARYVAPGRHRPEHWEAAKRVLRYLCSTSGMGLVLGGRVPVVLTGHADALWVDGLATQRSTQGYTFSLGSGSVSWRSTRSSSVLSSSCEAEIYKGAMAAQELRWLTYLLTDLGERPRSSPVLYVDNKAMIALCQEHRLEHRTKHIAQRYFLARELQQRGHFVLLTWPLGPTLLIYSPRHFSLVIISVSVLF